jgi:hypothetical protein
MDEDTMPKDHHPMKNEIQITLNSTPMTSSHRYSKSDIKPKKKKHEGSNLSSIKFKKSPSSPKEDTTFNFFDEVGFDLKNDETKMKEEKSKSKIHKDMEIMLGHMYTDNGLTVVSEEQSKQYTEYNFGRGKKNSSGFKTNFSESNSKGSSLKRGFLGNSIDDAVYMNRFKKGSDPRKKDSQERLKDQFMTQQVPPNIQRKNSSPYNNSTSDLNNNPKKNKKKRFKENIRISLEKNFSELLPTIKSKRGNKDEFLKPNNHTNSFQNDSNVRNSKFKTFGENKNLVIEFDLEKLPELPSEPDYPILLLNKVKSSKSIDKREHFAENKFFRLPCGLFYEGSLHFGKLQGKGVLLLKSIDISNRETKEMKENLLYEGYFFNNEVEGRGVLKFRDGSRFAGTFKHGVAHGNGTIIDKSGNQTIKGIWINGRYCQ